MMIVDDKIDADVIVVGGGIIGGSFASLLGQAGLKVILLDASKRQVEKLILIAPQFVNQQWVTSFHVNLLLML